MKILFLCISFVIVTAGQPATSPFFSALTSLFGYGIFFVYISERSTKARFWTATFFYTLVSIIQLRWFTSHPYLYIYAVLVLLSFLLGLQFGLTSLFATTERFKNRSACLIIPALWTLLEWSRLFLFSGFSFNPSGMSYSFSPWSLQIASLCGVLGLSFLVMLNNCFFARAWLTRKTKDVVQYAFVCLLPLTIGAALYLFHSKMMVEHDKKNAPIDAIIISLKKLPEELVSEQQKERRNPLKEAEHIWKESIAILEPYKGKSIDLIAFPEVAVPLPSSSPLFSNTFQESLFSITQISKEFKEYVHSSQDIAKELSLRYHTSVLMGLEGDVYNFEEKRWMGTNSAFMFTPEKNIASYDKQILVPMGEYIPFEWIKPLAHEYGLYDSFLAGKSATLFPFSKGFISPSICYEETFGNLMRQNAENATLLVNITNDGWFPNSSLAMQHFEHARPRTVENGIPLIRSCNYGISCAIDSLGRVKAKSDSDEELSATYVSLSSYTYNTLYKQFGDAPLIILCALILAYSLQLRLRQNSITS